MAVSKKIEERNRIRDEEDTSNDDDSSDGEDDGL